MTTDAQQRRNDAEHVTLVLQDDGYVVVRPMSTVRFLLDDGRTVDVVCDRDDSHVRGVLLVVTGAERIEGSAVIDRPTPKPTPTPRARKRT